MNQKLKILLDDATARVQAIEDAQTAEHERRDAQKRERDAADFKRMVQTNLGADVLEAIGPVAFVERFLVQAMTFQIEGQSFRLQQQAGAMVQLEETENKEFSYRLLGPKFDLAHDEDARSILLATLRKALERRTR